MKTFTKEQKMQLEKQAEFHIDKKYKTHITLAPGYVLENFTIHPNVLRPEIMTSLYLAKWLFYNNGLYFGKNVLDMGCGSGIQGVVLGLFGASHITFSDLSVAAVKNTEANIKQFGLSGKSTLFHSDLFEKISDTYDVIIFNHPFFSDHTIEQLLISGPNVVRGKLIHKFFKDAKKHLSKDGIIIMPYYHIAGPLNNPFMQAPEHGYDIFERMKLTVKSGLQQGDMSIYEIRLKSEN